VPERVVISLRAQFPLTFELKIRAAYWRRPFGILPTGFFCPKLRGERCAAPFPAYEVLTGFARTLVRLLVLAPIRMERRV
jgi:hypothetical protein